MAYRVRFVVDPDGQFEECNGTNKPLTKTEYAQNYYNDANGKRVPYDDYLRYYGNPDRHVYLGCVVQRQCPACECWRTVGSLWSIDFMDDQPEYLAIDVDTWMTEAEAVALPGYAADVARDVLTEAKAGA